MAWSLRRSSRARPRGPGQSGLPLEGVAQQAAAPPSRIGPPTLGSNIRVVVSVPCAGGRIGLFRPDLSLSGAADLLGIVATVLLAWLVVFDFPEGASREIGVFLALIGAMAVAGGAGDYSTLRGAPLFPPIDAEERRAP